MIAQTPGSDSYSLILLGGSLLAASFVLKQVVKFVVRMLDREAKPNLSEQESPLK
jgi:hypothetical protein